MFEKIHFPNKIVCKPNNNDINHSKPMRPIFLKGVENVVFNKEPDLLTFKECQELLKIGKNSLLKYLHSKEIDGVKIGNRWRIYKSSVIDFIKRR